MLENSLVQQILARKTFRGQKYYKVKWYGNKEPAWELESVCRPSKTMVKEFLDKKYVNDEEDDEWEVEEILEKRIKNKRVEYLVKWKDWTGDPTWEIADDCQCINLIAAFENPKLKRLWNFSNNNKALWLDRASMLKYIKSYLMRNRIPAKLLRFKPDFPQNEEQKNLNSGINIGPLIYENHWYLVIILINHICISRLILIGDPLNLLLGTRRETHPVIMRLSRVYKHFPIRPIALTQMDRSDVCGFHVLAALERALFLYQKNAKFIVDSINFDIIRAEQIRSELRPDTDGKISLALPIPDAFNHEFMCEFCKELFNARSQVDEHIEINHFTPKSVRGSSAGDSRSSS